MARQYFKTTERQRSSAAITRKQRAKVRKPQARDVDEALSAAVRRASRDYHRDLLSGCSVAIEPVEVFNYVFQLTIDHLVDVRSMNLEKSKAALRERLMKKRRYLVPAKSG
ncbi:hypothetical protein ACQQ2Q_04780 [Agrobacterium sp. ES01]|uniref:hypothetical protein n=1 Tax=Agrobacterium sp. ES01 TaxID=3420714 RepID=UPI003D0B3A20